MIACSNGRLSKAKILKKTNILSDFVLALIVPIAIIVFVYFVFYKTQLKVDKNITLPAIAFVLSLIPLTFSSKRFFAIVFGNYNICEGKLRGIFNFINGYDGVKVLDFGKVRIVVDEKKAKELNVDDNVMIVMIRGERYPALIEKSVNDIKINEVMF